jgi:hypothetical protein
LKRFVPLRIQVRAVALARRLEPGRVAAVIRLRETEADPVRAGDHAVEKHLLLFGRTEALHHHDDGKIADDRRLVLEIVVKAEAFCGEVLADDRHCEVRAVLSAELARQPEAQMAGLVGAAAHLGE